MRLPLFLLCLLGAFAAPLAAQDRLPPAPYAYRTAARSGQGSAREGVDGGAALSGLSGPVDRRQRCAARGRHAHEVRSKIAAGESPDEIKAWLVARYGNWVSYDPPFDGATAFLWLGPLLFLLLGGWLAFGRFRRGARDDAEDGA